MWCWWLSQYYFCYNCTQHKWNAIVGGYSWEAILLAIHHEGHRTSQVLSELLFVRCFFYLFCFIFDTIIYGCVLFFVNRVIIKIIPTWYTTATPITTNPTSTTTTTTTITNYNNYNYQSSRGDLEMEVIVMKYQSTESIVM